MIRITLRSLRSDGLRLLLSSLAVVLGVAFVAGTLVLTDGMRTSAYDRAGSFDRHTDVAVVAVDDPLAPAVLDRIRTIPGVRAADGEFVGTGGVLRRDGRPVLGQSTLVSVPTEPALASYDVVRGRLPEHPGEVVLDTRTATEEGFVLGSPVRVGGAGGPAVPFTLVGTVDVAGGPRDAGGAYVGLVGPDALRVAGASGYTRIMVAGQPGTPDSELAARIRAAATGSEAVVQTRAELLDQAVDAAVRDVRKFNAVLLLFGAVAVVVAAFVIANTFTIVLAQRVRRTALLRLVGATRRQVFRSVLLESATVGLVASVLGTAVGVGLAAVAGTMMRASGLPLPPGVTVRASTMAAALGLGVLVTVGAAVVPAWRGTRVPPVAALGDAGLQEARSAGGLRLILGAVVLCVGIAALALAGVTQQLPLVAVGGLLVFFGIVLFGPVLVPALVRVLGWPLGLVLGVPARLAVANAVRNPRRVSATATTLVIGIGLVSAFVVGAESTRAGIERSVQQKFGTGFLVLGINSELPDGLAAVLAARPELAVVHEQRSVVESGLRVQAGHPRLVARTITGVVAGDLHGFVPGTVLVDQRLATARGLGPGKVLTVVGQELRVAAVVTGASGEADDRVVPGQLVILHDADFTRLFPRQHGPVAQVLPAGGVSDGQARQAIEQVLADYPTVNVTDLAAYRRMLTSTVDQVLLFVTALLGLAVVIALVGVANTLALSVVERTRENGVLRAVGLTRGRLRGLLAVEAALTALVGALLGLGLGTAVGAGGVAFLNGVGGDFTVELPWTRLALVVVAAAVAALAASVLPARRAVNRPVVEALGSD